MKKAKEVKARAIDKSMTDSGNPNRLRVFHFKLLLVRNLVNDSENFEENDSRLN